MYTILAVDDAKDTLILLEQDLSQAGYKVLTADSGEAALSQIEMFDVDMVLLDMYMPGLSGLDVLQRIKKQDKIAHIPVVMLSASDDEDQFVAALEYGADDFVNKPYILKILLARIRNSFRFMEKSQELEQLAQTDFLTGVNNRGHFERLSHACISQCRRMDQNLVFAIFDLDYFKKINDQFGHEAGDIVLIEFSKLLSLCFREYDVIGRVGGEEFGVCLPNTDIEDAVYACDRLRKKLQNKHFVFTDNKSPSKPITVSAGLASARGKVINYESLFRKADCALYQAKNAGRNRIIADCINQDTQSNICVNTPEHCEPSSITVHKAEALIDKLTDESTTDNNVKTPKEELTNMIDTEEKFPGVDYEIGINNVLGDEALFEDILIMFFDDHAADIDNLKDAIENQDKSQLKHVAHTLKGVACSIGAMKLFEATRELDIAINDSQSEKYQTLYNDVAIELGKVIGGIKLKLAHKLG